MFRLKKEIGLLNVTKTSTWLSEKESGTMIGCVEEAAFRSGFIDKKTLFELASSMPESGYKNYLLKNEKQ